MVSLFLLPRPDRTASLPFFLHRTRKGPRVLHPKGVHFAYSTPRKCEKAAELAREVRIFARLRVGIQNSVHMLNVNIEKS